MSVSLTRRDLLKLGGLTALALTMPFMGEVMAFEMDFPAGRLPVLMYHDINNVRDDYTTSPSRFASHMEWLYANGYRAVSFDEAEKLLAEEMQRAVIITFDDGYASFIEFALPYLKEHGFKSTINIIGEKVGSFITLGSSRPVLGWNELRYLNETGMVALACHTFALHRITRNASVVSVEVLRDDLRHFKEVFKRELDLIPRALAWPYGKYNNRAMKVARDEGFSYIMTSRNGYLKSKADFDEVPRLNMNDKVDLKAYTKAVEGI